MKKELKGLILGAAIFIAIPTFAQEHKKDQNKEKAKAEMEAMFTSLELNEEQRERVKAIFKEERMAMKETKVAKQEMETMKADEKKVARAKATLKRDEMKSRTEAKLAEVLSPSQMAKYKTIQEEKMEQREEQRKERIENKPMKNRPSDASSN